MANQHPKKPNPEKARQRALQQWSNPEKRAGILSSLRKSNTIEPPKDAAEIVQKACENGCTVAEISRALGVSRQTLNRWKEDFPAIAEAFSLGRQVEHDRLVGALFDQAVNKSNTTAAIFLLRARFGYQDGSPLVQNSVSVNFTLPGAMQPDAYIKTLTAEAQLVKPEQARRLAADSKVKGMLRSELSRREAE